MSTDHVNGFDNAITHERDTRPLSLLYSKVAKYLEMQAGDLASRWEQQARNTGLANQQGTHTSTAQVAEKLIQAIAAAIASDNPSSEAGVFFALGFGIDAFESSTSFHNTLKSLELLTAMILYAVESAVSEDTVFEGQIADGVRLARRVNDVISILFLSTVTGYSKLLEEQARERFRALRHDLRNPLGTIKSVVSMMSDETLPLEVRSHLRFPDMAKRNIRRLDDLITARLSDTASADITTARQGVELSIIAKAVRRDLRAFANAREIRILLDSASGQTLVDSGSMELMLLLSLQAMLREGTVGETIHISFEASIDRARTLLRCDPQRVPVCDITLISQLMATADQMGIEIEIGRQMTLSARLR